MLFCMLPIRGVIQNRARAKQLRDFSGLHFGNITPTDIDGLIEYHGKAYVILELKLTDAILSDGQRLALERLTDDLSRSGKKSLCIIASHDTQDSEGDIDVANAIVAEYRWGGKWLNPKIQYNVKQFMDLFLAKVVEV